MCHCTGTLPKDNLTAVVYGINDLRLEDKSIPEPGPDEALICMESVAICGSDVVFLREGKVGSLTFTKPIGIGHEASGTVVKVGETVKHLKQGDHVGIDPGLSCKACQCCKDGHYNLCPGLSSQGKLARYCVHPADQCHKLADHVTFDEAALAEPLGVAIHACKRAGVTAGSTVLVMGAGSMGLLVMKCAKLFGASKVLITDIAQPRLLLAERLGADHTLLTDENGSVRDTIKQITDTLGCMPCVTIDCCSAERAAEVALQVTRTGGVVVLLGLSKRNVTLPLTAAIFREVDIRGSYMYTNEYLTALDLISTQKIDVNRLVTHHYRIEDTVAAFNTAMKTKGEPVKVIIHTNPQWKQ